VITHKKWTATLESVLEELHEQLTNSEDPEERYWGTQLNFYLHDGKQNPLENEPKLEN
jgi:hypothetical protein